MTTDGGNSRELSDAPVLMSAAEVRNLGVLQELNRCFLHPLGLALGISEATDPDGMFRAEMWDYRDDPEGIVYGPGVTTRAKFERVAELRDAHAAARAERFGGPTIQPLD